MNWDDGEPLDVMDTIKSALEYSTDRDICLAGFGGATAALAFHEIAEMVAGSASSPDSYGSVDLAALVRLHDGRYAAIMAWADTTGWGCRDGLTVRIAPDRGGAIAALGDGERRKLGFELDAAQVRKEIEA